MRGGDGTSEGCLGCAERDRNEVEMTSQPLMLFCFLHRKMSHLFRKCLYVLCAWRFGSAKYSCQTMTVPIFPQNKSDKMSKTVAYIVPYLRNCSEFLTSWVCGSRKLKYDGSGRFLCTAINIDRRIWGIPGCLCVGGIRSTGCWPRDKKICIFQLLGQVTSIKVLRSRCDFVSRSEHDIYQYWGLK